MKKVKRIILVQYRPAIRLYKWAVTLTEMGYDITIGHTCAPAGWLHWGRFNLIDITDKKDFSAYDYYVSFNPGLDISFTPTTKVIQAVGDIKSASTLEHYPEAKRNKILVAEIKNMRASRFNIFVSESQKNFAIKEMGIPQTQCMAITNGIIDELIGDKLPKLNNGKINLVYCGTLTNIENHHRNIIKNLCEIADNDKYMVHILPSYVSKLDGYEHPNIQIHPTVSPYSVVSYLSQFDAGLLLMGDKQIGDMCMPNKVNDYLAAGLPILSEPFTEIKKLNEKVITIVNDWAKIPDFKLIDTSNFVHKYENNKAVFNYIFL